MVDYRASSDLVTDVKLKSRAGKLIGIVAMFIALLGGLLFVSGFWNARPLHADALPLPQTSAEARQQASAAAVSNAVIAGTMTSPVDLPPARRTQD